EDRVAVRGGGPSLTDRRPRPPPCAVRARFPPGSASHAFRTGHTQQVEALDEGPQPAVSHQILGGHSTWHRFSPLTRMSCTDLVISNRNSFACSPCRTGALA